MVMHATTPPYLSTLIHRSRPAWAGTERNPLLVEDFDFTLLAPERGFKFINVETPREDVGPAPERSPVRARFDSEDGKSSLSVTVRSSQNVKYSLIQASHASKAQYSGRYSSLSRSCMII